MTLTTTCGTALAPLPADFGDWDHTDVRVWGTAITGWGLMPAIIGLAGWALWTASELTARNASGSRDTAHAKSLPAVRHARSGIDKDEHLERNLETDHG